MKSRIMKGEKTAGYLFLLPSLLGFAFFILLPVLGGFTLSFTNYNGFKDISLVGISNYLKLFQDDYFRVSFLNNLFYTCTSVPLTLLFALLLALAINRKNSHLNNALKTVFFLPTITSMVAVGIVWGLLFHPVLGPVNSILKALGMQNPPGWLVSSKWALTSVVIVTAWKQCGYYMIMILSGLQTIPRELYESADIDGANTFRKFWSVTCPMLSPTIFMVIILAIIDSFQVFDLIYVMTQGGPGRATNVIVYRIYQEGFTYMRFGYASAMAYFLFLIIFIVTVIQFRGQKKWVNYMQ